MNDIQIIVNVDIRDPNKVNISIEDNYGNIYGIHPTGLLRKKLDILFEQKVNSKIPVTDTEAIILKNEVEALCTRYNHDLIPSEPYSTPEQKSHFEEYTIPREIEEIKKVISSYKTMLGKKSYTEGEQKYILNRVTNAIRKVNDECMDNFRFSDGSAKSLIKYGEIKSHGCCGFYDEEIELKSGKKFFFGFNYGH